ncbi:MAG TPA: ABC transporter permease [Candidatus Acidoferrales bacterium]|nr:ABC transporter permease [Candidatus Acidoferrales bacterium]
MNWVKSIAMRVFGMFASRRSGHEMDDELQTHFEMLVEQNVRRGMALDEARRAARLELGGEQQIKEAVHDQRGLPFLESLFSDVRYAGRMLRKSPGFTIVALLTLALGIGANTAIFSVVNGVLLNPLPYPDPGRLVTVYASKRLYPHGSISYPNFLDWHRLNQCFSFFAVSRATGYLLTGVGKPEELNAAAITSDFFPVLGIKPVLGGNFPQRDDQIGVSHDVVISTDLWQRKFGGSPTVVGREISLDGKGYTIVGVFPGHLNLPMTYFDAVDVYTPLGQFPNRLVGNRLAGLGIHGIARLKPGVTLDQARADMARVTGELAKTYPEADKDMGAGLTPMKETMVGRVRGFLLLLLGAVGLVLLIACVNVANLLLARGRVRAREVAVRSALGAGVGRLVRQMLTESMLLAGIGGALGVAIAAAGTRAALAALPATLPRASEVGIDARVLWFSALITVCAGIFFGLLPAIQIARRGSYETLKQGTRGAGGSRNRTQGALVMVQMALALVLLAGAGLLIRSLAQLWNVNPGFDPNHLITFNLAMAPQMSHAPPAEIRQTLRNFDATMAAVPGVQAESLSWGALPMYNEDDENFWICSQPRPASESQMYGMLDYIVGPDYLKAMRIPLLEGRFLTAEDNEHSRYVVVVDEVLARKYFPNGNAVGQSICQGDATHTFPFEIVGVVGHVKQWGLDTDAGNSLRAQVYFPFMQLSDAVMSVVPSNTSVVVRSSGDVIGLVESIRNASDHLDSNEVLTSFQTMHEIIQGSLASRRFAMMLLGAFAAVALLLAVIGLYGVISYGVGQRTHEMGVRLALGAHPRDVFRLVIGQGLKFALAGVGVGAIAAFTLVRVVSSFSELLYGVRAWDPLTLTAVSFVLVGAALLACYMPARKAMRVDPLTALRYE